MKDVLMRLIEKGGNLIINVQKGANFTIGNENKSEAKQLEYPQNQKLLPTKDDKEQGQISSYDNNAKYKQEQGDAAFFGFFR